MKHKAIISITMVLLVFPALFILSCSKSEKEVNRGSRDVEPETEAIKDGSVDESRPALKPVVELEPDELEVVSRLTAEVLLRYVYGTREGTDITMWSSPQRDDIMEEGTRYAVSTVTWYMYPDPAAVVDSQDEIIWKNKYQVIWKDPENPKNVELRAPLEINVYSFALKKPIATTRLTIIRGINRELSWPLWIAVPKRGQSYCLGKVFVCVTESETATAADGTKLHDVTLLPLTVLIKGGTDCEHPSRNAGDSLGSAVESAIGTASDGWPTALLWEATNKW